jgi:transposase
LLQQHQSTVLTEQQISALRQYVLPLIPKNKRGFSSKHDPLIILQCIIHKLKTGCQWRYLFIELKGVTAPFSWELVYYYFRKWLKAGVFGKAFELIVADKQDELITNNLYLDGSHALSKKGGMKSLISTAKGRGRPTS